MTLIKVDRLAELLRAANYPIDKTRNLVQGFSEGFDIGNQGPTDRADLSNNLPLRIGSLTEIWNKFMKEVKLGRYAGPFSSVPYDNFIQSLVGLVPKDNGAKTRLIFHLSYNFKRNGKPNACNSVNHHTLAELCSVRYKDLDQAIKACLKRQTKCVQFS